MLGGTAQAQPSFSGSLLASYGNASYESGDASEPREYDGYYSRIRADMVLSGKSEETLEYYIRLRADGLSAAGEKNGIFETGGISDTATRIALRGERYSIFMGNLPGLPLTGFADIAPAVFPNGDRVDTSLPFLGGVDAAGLGSIGFGFERNRMHLGLVLSSTCQTNCLDDSGDEMNSQQSILPYLIYSGERFSFGFRQASDKGENITTQPDDTKSSENGQQVIEIRLVLGEATELAFENHTLDGRVNTTQANAVKEASEESGTAIALVFNYGEKNRFILQSGSQSRATEAVGLRNEASAQRLVFFRPLSNWGVAYGSSSETVGIGNSAATPTTSSYALFFSTNF